MNFEDARTRRRVYLAAALVCFVAAFALLGMRSIERERALGFPNPNGLGYYMYLPSLVIDGDLDFRNQALRSLGEAPDWVVSGRYPMGVALTLIPTFLVAHVLSWGFHALTGSRLFTPDGFTLFYQVLNLAGILALWTTAMLLMDRLLRRRLGFPGVTALSAVLLFWLGSYAFWYVVRSPFWGHVLSTAWLIVALYLFDRVLDDVDRSRVTARLPLLGFAMSMAVLCRLTDVFMAPFAGYLVIRLYRGGLLGQALRQLPLILLAIAPVLIQLWIWQTGGAVPSSPESIGYAPKERFYWTEPVLFLPLVSSLQGLFFYSPVLLWSAWGLAWGVSTRAAWRDPLVVCLVLSALVLWYLNASWYAWWFGGDAFGARAFLELGGLFILGFAFAVEHLRTRARAARIAIASGVAAALLAGYALMFARAVNWLPSETRTFLFAWERERYGHLLLRARDPERYRRERDSDPSALTPNADREPRAPR